MQCINCGYDPDEWEMPLQLKMFTPEEVENSSILGFLRHNGGTVLLDEASNEIGMVLVEEEDGTLIWKPLE